MNTNLGLGSVFRYRTHDEDEIYVVLGDAIAEDGNAVVIVMWADGHASDFLAAYVNDDNDTPL